MQVLDPPLLDLADVFVRDYGRLCRIAALLVGSRTLAEELVMDAFERTLRARPEFPDPGRASAYLRRAVINNARNALRRRRHESAAVSRVAGLAETTSPAADHHGDANRVLAAVGRLPARQRAAVVLRYYADLPEAEIAEALECSVGTVKSQLAKARVRLARLLDDRGGES
jgi:RNA polymerase sigma-70 factor (sigma-E family)